jgi:hypothetical protein
MYMSGVSMERQVADLLTGSITHLSLLQQACCSRENPPTVRKQPMHIDIPHPKVSLQLRLCGPGDTDALCDWCDVFLQGDYFFRRKHMQGLLSRATSRVFSIVIDSVCCGMVAVYKGSTLHNLYLQPEYRQYGVGSAIIQTLQPTVIRSKSNMMAGDPAGFYAQNGYHQVTQDAGRPHIKVLTNDPALGPQLIADEAKRAANKERMQKLRDAQARKKQERIEAAATEMLRARGLLPSTNGVTHGASATTPLENARGAAEPPPVATGAPAAAAPPPSPTPPAPPAPPPPALSPESFVFAGTAGAGSPLDRLFD